MPEALHSYNGPWEWHEITVEAFLHLEGCCRLEVSQRRSAVLLYFTNGCQSMLFSFWWFLVSGITWFKVLTPALSSKSPPKIEEIAESKMGTGRRQCRCCWKFKLQVGVVVICSQLQRIFMDCVCFMKLFVLKPRKLTCHTQSQTVWLRTLST